MGVGTTIIFLIFLMSLKYGSRDITKSDTSILIASLVAIIVWWQLKDPLLAVLMATTIDVVGYIPSWRKSYRQPWSETVSSWILATMANIFSILALREFNILTLTYLDAITVANSILLAICILRRRSISQPVSV